MEKSIESAIDIGLESISTQLYIFSILLGISLITLGIYVFLNNKDSTDKKSIKNRLLACIFVGIIAIVSGLIQI